MSSITLFLIRLDDVCTQETISNLYRAAYDVRYPQQFQILLHSNPATIDPSRNLHFDLTSCRAFYAGNPSADARNDATVIIPSFFEEKFLTFHNTLYKRKRNMLKTVVDMESYVRSAFKV